MSFFIVFFVFMLLFYDKEYKKRLMCKVIDCYLEKYKWKIFLFYKG